MQVNNNVTVNPFAKLVKWMVFLFICFGCQTEGNAQVMKMWGHRYFVNDTLLYTQNQTLVTPNGLVYVCGSVYNEGDTYVQTFLLQYDTLGNLNWQKTIDSTFHQSYLAVDAENNIYINGINRNTNGGIFLIKYDVYGNLLWRSNYMKPGGIDWVYDLKIDEANNIYSGAVMAWVYPTLLKYDPNGNLQLKVEDSVSGYQNASVSFALDLQQNIIFLFTDYYQTYLSKYNSSGSRLWKETYAATANTGWAHGFNVRCDKLNKIYFIASTDNSNSKGDFAIVKYNEDGQLAWDRFFSGSSYYDYPEAMTLDNEANIYVTGTIHPYDCINDSFATIKYDSSGNMKWVNYYSSPDCNNDWPVSIGFSNDGFIYVVGKGGDTDYGSKTVLLKYTKEGNLLALTRFNMNSGSWDVPYSMAMDAHGYIYVSGVSEEPGFKDVFITKWSIKSNVGLVEKVSNMEALKIYPNPANTDFTLSTTHALSSGQFLLYDINGKLMIKKEGLIGRNFNFSCDEISAGFYFYVVSENGNNTAKGKLIIEK